MKGFIEASMMALIVLAGGCSVLFVPDIIPIIKEGNAYEWDGLMILVMFLNVAGFVIAIVAGLVLRKSLRSKDTR